MLEYLHPIVDRPILDLGIASARRLERCVSAKCESLMLLVLGEILPRQYLQVSE